MVVFARHVACMLALCLPSVALAQSCDSSALLTDRTRASDTDANIRQELVRHYSFFNPACPSNNTLLLHLAGSFDAPASTTLFPELAANNGFHVINLKYENGTAALSACSTSTDPMCYLKFRKEILEGVDSSPAVDVDTAHSIHNRLVKLLQYLDDTYPDQHWGQYVSDNTVNWNAVYLSGHSQGGGHAALLGVEYPVGRILMFASPNDYSTFFNAPAPWTMQAPAAGASAYYGFNNLHDDIVPFANQFDVWRSLGLPAFGDSVHVETTDAPYAGSHQLYTTYTTTGLSGNHNAVLLDQKTPLDDQGNPRFLPVWKYMLGILPTGTASNPVPSFADGVDVYPNPARTTLSVRFDDHVSHVNVHLYDITGKRVASYRITGRKGGTFDISTFANGVYMLRVDATNISSVWKTFIKN